jgi:diadenylate cyclase
MTFDVFIDFLQSQQLWKAVIEILLLATVFYWILRFLQESLGASVLRGLAVFIVVMFVVLLFFAQQFEMRVITALLTSFPEFFAIGLIIMFQPELRRALVRLGESRLLRRVFRHKGDVITTIVGAVTNMAEKQIGALICLEREVSLNTYVDGGIKLDSQITNELMVTLFYPGTPLHDGAAILRDDRLVAAGCLFPLSENPVVSRGLGTRHRAGIGVTEQSDALAIMVSEENGQISFAVRGTITRGLSPEELERTLRQIYVERKEPQGAVT